MAELTPLPFLEAIAWARARGVVLPDTYYGELQGLARAMAFSIAGLAKLDQLQQVMDSLADATASGESFAAWAKRATDPEGAVRLDLPAHRVENIFRTNVQGHYARGRCEQQKGARESHPYLLFDATNDSRTRPAHAAMDGFVAHVDDPVWKTWRPPAGYQCRCRVIALTERQAERFRNADAKRMEDSELASARGVALTGGPDTGWDYDVCAEPTEGLRRAIERKRRRCGGSLAAGAPADDALWCGHPVLRDALTAMVAALGDWRNEERLLRSALPDGTYDTLLRDIRPAAAATGLTDQQGVVLRAYTDRDLIAWPLMNTLARELPHFGPLTLSEQDVFRAGILIQFMDAAVAQLPARPGVFNRGIDSLNLGATRERFLSAHRTGVLVQYEGYTSVMDGTAYSGDILQRIDTGAVDIAAFSKAKEPELLLPRHIALRVVGVDQAPGDSPKTVVNMKQEQVDKPVPQRRLFAQGEEPVGGKTAKEALEEWIEARKQPHTPTQAELDRYERMQVEAGGPIPARFNELQYINKKRNR